MAGWPSTLELPAALPLLMGLLIGLSLQPLASRLLGDHPDTHGLHGTIKMRISQSSEIGGNHTTNPPLAPCIPEVLPQSVANPPAACNCSLDDGTDGKTKHPLDQQASSPPGLAFASFLYPSWPRQGRPGQPELPKPPKKRKDAVDPGVLWGYSPALHPRALQRGLLQHGDPARLRRFVAKLLQGKPVVVAAVGGSISVGRGAANQPGIDTSWPSYLDQFQQWLQAAFPASQARLVNAAQGGTTSNMFDACAETLVPPESDLVVVEFALNDGTMAQCTVDDRGRTDQGSIPARASYERLLRKLQRLPSRPAVVVVQSFSFIRGSTGSFHKSAENDMDVFASYYGLPVMSVRAAMYHLMAQNLPGYRVDMVRSDNKERTQPTDLLFWDISHPYGPTGHRYMAELLIGLTQMTAGSLQLKPLQEEEEAIAAEHIPPPLLPGNYQKKAASCLLSKGFENAVAKSRGFVWINERPDALSSNDEKWGWVGTTPGSWVELLLDSRSRSDAADVDQGPEDITLPLAIRAARDILAAYNGRRPPVTLTLEEQRQAWEAAKAQQQAQASNSSGSSSSNSSSSESTVGDSEDSESSESNPQEGESSGSLSQVLLGHLASYSGMGQARVECMSGCSCNATTLDGHWKKNASLQVMHAFMVTEHPACRIRVTIQQSTSSGEGGHKVKLTALVVLAGGTSELLSQPGRLEYAAQAAAAQGLR